MLYSNEDDDGEDYHQCDVYARHSIDTTLGDGKEGAPGHVQESKQ